MSNSIIDYYSYLENILNFMLKHECELHRGGFYKACGMWFSKGSSIFERRYKDSKEIWSLSLPGAMIFFHHFWDAIQVNPISLLNGAGKLNFSYKLISDLSQPKEFVWDGNYLMELKPMALDKLSYDATIAFVTGWDGIAENSIYAQAHPEAYKLSKDLSIKYLGEFPKLD